MAVTASPALGAAGGLDPSFDGDGKLDLGLGNAKAVAVQPDGKLVFAGAGSGGNAIVYRLNPNGSLDPSFDVDGKAIIDSGGVESASAVALQPDGKIVVAGTTTAGTGGTDDAAVYRLKANGGTTNAINDALDPSFDVDGAAGIDNGGEEAANALALQPDGRIVVAGSTSAGAGGTTDAAVYRLKANGGTTNAVNDALDPTFDVDGAAGIDGGSQEDANALALEPNGKIVVAGFTNGGAGGTSDAVVWRLKADGGATNTVNDALDPTFDVDGVAGIDSGDNEFANALALQPDGKIVVAGFRDVAAGRDAAVYRLTANGGTTNTVDDALDLSFGVGGAAVIDAGALEEANAIALQPDRRIVVAGNTTPGSISPFDATAYRLFGDPFTLAVRRSGSGAGSVSSSPPGIDCGATCSAPFDDGTSVTLTALPAAESKFTGWSGSGCSGTGTCTVILAADRNVTASFAVLPPPNTKISKAKINQAKNSAKFKFKAVGGTKAKASSRFQCALLKKKKHRKPKVRFRGCKSPKRYKHLKLGRYTFEVRALSAAGKDPTPAKRKFRIKP